MRFAGLRERLRMEKTRRRNQGLLYMAAALLHSFLLSHALRLPVFVGF